MSKVIYSLYIDIPKEELDLFDSNILKKNEIPTNYNTKNKFKQNYSKLINCKKDYAKQIGVDFKMFEYDKSFILYQKTMKTKYPFLTSYNVVNFYKIHLLYKLAEEYDDILYLDFDVVPMKNINFFDNWNLSKGIAVLSNTDKVKRIEEITEYTQTIRSPTSKYYNAQAMLIERNLNPVHEVVNTGIIGINKKHLTQLKYFDNFELDLKQMSNLINSNEIFPSKLTNFFGWDNETLFAVKLVENNINVQWLNNEWHYFFDTQFFIPENIILCHTINKKFEIVWRRYENNI
jgi:hypothetical protein